ncbi:MAG: triple tyrosine motif-containing protein, partial [Verrucomicrobia bacterium]|nr:triple tyrosine motif-containing protein [Verrucomicrobiota bacterium]
RIRNGSVVEPGDYLTGKTGTVDANQVAREQDGQFWFAQEGRYGQLRNGRATNMVQAGGNALRLCASRSGGMWLLGGGQLLKLITQPDGNPGTVASWPTPRYDVSVLFEDRQGSLWLGTRNQGLFRFDQGEFHPVMQNWHAITDIFEDKEGTLWVGTEGGGLHKIRPRIFHVLNTLQGLPQNTIAALGEDRAGQGWATTRNGSTACFTATGRVSPTPSVFTNNSASVILPDPDGSLWIGTKAGKLLRYAESNLQSVMNDPRLRNHEVQVLHLDRKNQLWFGLGQGGLARYAEGKTVFSGYFQKRGLLNAQTIWAVAESTNGVLWFGTSTGELCRYEDDQFTVYRQTNGLPGTAIGALYCSADNTLWIGTLGDGLGCFHNGRFKFVSVKQGLHDSVISQIVEDDFGCFWFGSTRGIFRVRKTDLDQFMAGQHAAIESISYGKADGLTSAECNGGYQPSVWKTRAGHLWFATSKGVVQVDPGALPLNPNPPPLALEQVLVNDQPVAPATPLVLEWHHKNLEFKYTALSFIAPEKVRFRRQLVGFDADWVTDDTARAAKYPRLAPGRYEFRFTACNDTGLWNEHPATFAFTVTPAWWQTRVFRAATLLVLLAAFGALVRYFSIQKTRRALARLAQAHAVEQERTRIARDIHDDVGARLTQMAYLSDMAATDLAKGAENADYLRQIADSSRLTVRALDEIVWAVNPRKDSLPHLVEYISQYANGVFRDTEIRCRQDLPAALPEWPLPAEFRHHLFLATKEALNNVCKHSCATEVWFRVTAPLPLLELIIEDNGAGFSPASGNPGGDGLRNMRARLANLGGECRIESKPGAGTRLCLRIKLPPR